MNKMMFLIGFLGLGCAHVAEPIVFRSHIPLYQRHGVSIGLLDHSDLPGSLVLAGMAAAMTGKVLYDCSCQNAYFSQIRCLYSDLVTSISNHEVASLKQLADCASYDFAQCEDILKLESIMRYVYGSWLTPWNWTSVNRSSYAMAQVLSIVAIHPHLLALGNELTVSELESWVRGTCGLVSCYPLSYYEELIQSHVRFIDAGLPGISDSSVRMILSDMSQPLRKIQSMLKAVPSYTLEVQLRKMSDLLVQIKNNQRNSGW